MKKKLSIHVLLISTLVFLSFVLVVLLVYLNIENTQEEARSENTENVQNDNTSISPMDSRAGYSFYSIEAVHKQKIKETKKTKEFEYVAITTKNNPQIPFHIACHLGENEITALLPSGSNLSSIILDFSYIGEQVIYDGNAVVSGSTILNLSRPTTFTLYAKDGSSQDINVRIETLDTGLPSIAITTEKYFEISSKTEKINTKFYAGGGDPSVIPYAANQTILMNGTIKGRGHTSWAFPKKGYTIELEKKVALFDLPESKHWVVVSNYQDKTLLRNYLASELALGLGMEAVMKVRPVDLWLNGEYYGNYCLMEKVEIEENRINITDFDSSLDESQIGYVLEACGHVSEVSDEVKAYWQNVGGAILDPINKEMFFQTSQYGMYVNIKEPSISKLEVRHVNYLTNYYETIEQAIKSMDINEIEAVLDLESFVNWYIVEDYFKNMDSGMWSSCYMYKDGNGKLHMGPVWDFDLSSGNCNYGDVENPVGSFLIDCSWFKTLFSIPEFQSMVKSRWNEVKGSQIDPLVTTLEQMAQTINLSQIYNFQKWDILSTAVGANPDSIVNANTFEKQIELLKNFMIQRAIYLDEVISTYPDEDK